jgi:hypothetical protein
MFDLMDPAIISGATGVLSLLAGRASMRLAQRPQGPKRIYPRTLTEAHALDLLRAESDANDLSRLRDAYVAGGMPVALFEAYTARVLAGEKLDAIVRAVSNDVELEFMGSLRDLRELPPSRPWSENRAAALPRRSSTTCYHHWKDGRCTGCGEYRIPPDTSVRPCKHDWLACTSPAGVPKARCRKCGATRARNTTLARQACEHDWSARVSVNGRESVVCKRCGAARKARKDRQGNPCGPEPPAGTEVDGEGRPVRLPPGWEAVYTAQEPSPVAYVHTDPHARPSDPRQAVRSPYTGRYCKFCHLPHNAHAPDCIIACDHPCGRRAHHWETQVGGTAFCTGCGAHKLREAGMPRV